MTSYIFIQRAPTWTVHRALGGCSLPLLHLTYFLIALYVFSFVFLRAKKEQGNHRKISALFAPLPSPQKAVLYNKYIYGNILGNKLSKSQDLPEKTIISNYSKIIMKSRGELWEISAFFDQRYLRFIYNYGLRPTHCGRFQWVNKSVLHNVSFDYLHNSV